MKKKGELNLFISEEIQKIKKYISEKRLEYATQQFFNTVRLALASIFDIDYQFTYEELVYKIEHMEESLNKADKKIREIKKKIDEEYAQKKKKSVKVLRKTIKSLNAELDTELDKQQEYMRINRVLLEKNYRDVVTKFIKEISDLKYSQKKIPRKEILSLIKEFENISHKILELQKEITKKHYSIFTELKKLVSVNKISRMFMLGCRA